MQSEDIRWDLYPQVASIAEARAFVVRLRQFSRRPKTIDAYARHLDRYLASFGDAPAAHWIEADEGTLLTYLDDLRYGRIREGASQGGRHLRTWSICLACVWQAPRSR